MTDERKQQLFPYFAYMYSQQLDPDKYGSINSIDEWSDMIQDNQDDMTQITSAASQLSDDEWDQLEKQYTDEAGSDENQNVNQDAAYAKKGMKLKKLQDMKKSSKPELMKKGGMKKKCECGCAVVSKKEKGGQIVEACSCCGKIHSTESFQQGGDISKFQHGGQGNLIEVGAKKVGDWLLGGMASIGRNINSGDTQTLSRAIKKPIAQHRFAEPTESSDYDTHVGRVPNRIAPTTPTTPAVTKKPVSQLVPKNTTQKAPVKNRINAPVKDAVSKWQEKLKAEGFDLGKGGVDGKWGTKTEAAYQAYIQHKNTINKVGPVENDNAPFTEQRQGFNPAENNYYGNAESFKKGGSMKKKIVKKQSGGDSTSAMSQLGVAKKGAKMKALDRVEKHQAGNEFHRRRDDKVHAAFNRVEVKPKVKVAQKGIKVKDASDAQTKSTWMKGIKTSKVDNTKDELGRKVTPEKVGTPDQQMGINPNVGFRKKPVSKKNCGGALTKAAMKANEKKNTEIANPVITPAEKDIMLKSRIQKARLKAKRK